MGTTRIKVIDLSSQEKEIKTSRKHAEKLTGVAKLKEGKKPITKGTEKKHEITEESTSVPSVIPEPSTEPETTKPTVPSKPSKPSQSTHGKRYLAAKKLVDAGKLYPIGDAFDLLSKTSLTKFDPTIEVHFNVADKNLKGKVKLPHSIGQKKEKRYLLFTDQTSALTAGMPETKNQKLIIGNEKTIGEIESGKLKPFRDFDVVITTPQFMPSLAKIAKILGPKGLMPNPKNGTIVEDVEKALSGNSQDLYEYRTDPTAPIIHTKIGKLSSKQTDLEENLKALIFAIGPTKIKKATLKSTMSPGIKLDLASLSSPSQPSQQSKSS